MQVSTPARRRRPRRPAPRRRFTVRYHEGNRALEIKFAAPLDRFRTVKVELLEGIAQQHRQPAARALVADVHDGWIGERVLTLRGAEGAEGAIRHGYAHGRAPARR